MFKNKAKTKMIAIVASLIFSAFILVMPIILAAGAVAVPVVAIYEIFSGIGDFLFGDGKENDAILLIRKYLDQPSTKKEINEKYQPLINNEEEIQIQLHWLLIPNLLAGIEEVKEEHIKMQISSIKKSDSDLERYINDLRTKTPWKDKWSSISTSTIVAYVEQFTSYLGQEEDLDIGDLKEEELLYPLKDKAVVTSEFGNRGSIDTGNGSTNLKHTGIDLAYNGGNAKTCGIPIYASTSGEVTKTEATVDQAGANWGAIQYKNLETWYLHMRDPFPYPIGTKIKKGQFIGYIGNSGLSTGCHLHMETRVDGKAVNPRKFLDF